MLGGNSNTLSIISIDITKILTGLGIRTITYRNKGLHRDDACDMRSMEICDFFHCSCSKENRETDEQRDRRTERQTIVVHLFFSPLCSHGCSQID